MSELNLQQVFDKVSTHLLTQNAKSRECGACKYRDVDGRKCAIGCLIDDKIYTRTMEKYNISGLWDQNILHCDRNNSDTMLYLLEHLQMCHDSYPVVNWKRQLKTIADSFGLVFDVV